MHIKHMHEMIECLTEYGKCMIEAGTGDGKVNLCDAGQVVDMIKDLADAEYHARIAKAMEKEEDEEEAEEKYMLKRFKEEYGEEDGEKKFYDDYRYKRSGRFAPKGRGSYMPRRGYEEPIMHMPAEMMGGYDMETLRDMDREKFDRMYYSGDSTSGSSAGSYSDGYDDGSRKGYEEGYRDGERTGKSQGGNSRYDRAKRGYEETKETHKGNTPQEKQEKMKSLENYMKELAEDVTDMISDATPEERNLLKQKMQVMIQKIS